MRRAAPPTRARRARRPAGPPGAPDFEPERLQKVLARAGLASRREAEAWIRAGRLTVNGAPATLGVRVGPRDAVRLDGRAVRSQLATAAPRAYLCHRSPGEALRPPGAQAPGETAPKAGRTALTERLPRRAGRRFVSISPMPRVDGGLELLSADGELAVRLQRAVHALASEFSVRVRGELSAEQVEGALRGTLDSGTPLAVARVEPGGGEGSNRWYTVEVQGASGKEVRQLIERQGALVSRVLRTRLGPLTLERTLGRGRFREVTQEELEGLLPAPAG